MISTSPDPTKVAFFLVDDNDLEGEVFRRAMQRHGIENKLEFVSDPILAMDAFRQRLQNESDPRLIIFLDLNMPGISGHDLLAEIRDDENLAPSLVFILTTSDHERDVRRAYRQNVAGYFTKSQLDGLMNTIKPYCESVVFPLV